MLLNRPLFVYLWSLNDCSVTACRESRLFFSSVDAHFWPFMFVATCSLLSLYSLSSLCQCLGYHADYVQSCRPLFEQALSIPSGTKRPAEPSLPAQSKKPRLGQSCSSTMAMVSRSNTEGMDHWAEELGMYQSIPLNAKLLIRRRQSIP